MVIPYGRQDIQQSDISAVLEVLQSEYLTQGPTVPIFEELVTEYCGADYGIAVNSATSALHIALLSLDVGPGDTVWSTPITFVASSNAALYCGANVDFVDIDPQSYNMCPLALEKKLLVAKKQGALPKVVMPVHLTGQPCDMKSIHDLSKDYGFKVVEDASHAIGATYLDHTIGNCKFSDITVFSFHPVKIITTAEGGMALTNNKKIAEKMRLLRSHGITRNASEMINTPDGPWYYEQIDLGFNYRMTDLQAALGVSQMKRLDEYVKRRHEIADRYNRELATLPLILPKQSNFSYSAYHLYVVKMKLAEIAPLTHSLVFQQLRDRGILVNLHYIPVHTQPYYRKLGFRRGDFPNAEDYYRSAISIPMFPSMTDEMQSEVIQKISEVVAS